MSQQQFPEPTAGALILNPKGEIFLMKSHKWRNKRGNRFRHLQYRISLFSRICFR